MTNRPKTNSSHSQAEDANASPPEDNVGSSVASEPAAWRIRADNWATALSWVVNPLVLLIAFYWVYRDGRALRDLELLIDHRLDFGEFSRFKTEGSLGPLPAVTPNLYLFVGLISAVGTLIWMFKGLFTGRPRFRSMRAWLAFTALAAGWLGFIFGWPEVYWIGQQHRVIPMLAPAEKMARFLNAHWPDQDGDLAGIGPFLAYPHPRPTVMLPLRAITFPDSPLRFSAVERSYDGAIRFELAGGETGAWLEWRADDTRPTPFKGGLETSYDISRQQQLAPHWYLVRYHPNLNSL